MDMRLNFFQCLGYASSGEISLLLTSDNIHVGLFTVLNLQSA